MKIFQFATCLLMLMFAMAGCKKNSEKPKEDDLPQFGTCKPAAVEGHLTLSGTNNGIFTYSTSGGGKIVMDANVVTFSHKDYRDFTIQFWGTVQINNQTYLGGPHENLNGKHVKDRTGTRRTIIFPDGTKFTMSAESTRGQTNTATIYEGNECHHINLACNTLEYSSANSPFAKRLDDTEADGETGTFEFTATGLLFLNIYNEDTPNQKVEKRVPLGEIYKDLPNRVDDYWP